jgi:hypothetical protein
MTLHDESILSAYLDGQLGPEEQQAVESDLLDDPRLAEDLASLAGLRDLLAGLPRESPVDLTTRVMRRVRRRALLGTARGVVAWGPVRAAGLAAMAAGVLMMLAAPWFLQFRRGPARAPQPDMVTLREAVRKARPSLSKARWPVFPSHTVGERSTQPGGSEERRPSQEQSADRAGSAQDELVDVREYLDNPQLRHIFLVTDLGDGSDEQRVADVVEHTTQFNYYKITISQGIVLDPRHPDQATVFALVVGPRELESLRERLRRALNDRVEEESAEPGVITRLADIGHVEACSPSPSANMDIPREDLAFKDQITGVVREAAEPPRAEHPNRTDRPTPEQERSSPAAEFMDRSLVVLVWVSRLRPG